MHAFRNPLVALFLLTASTTSAQKNSDTARSDAPDSLKNISLAGLGFRSIGPAVTGGRIVDIAVNPKRTSEYYAASGHGSLWKTMNNGTTFTPAFENQGSFSMGCVRVDPSNPNIVWVGTGESNNQSNVIYGDGIYRSEDGAKSWKNMGLQNAEHIGGIVIDPTNSNTVYAAAYGSLRNSGGDRGIYKTNDGGKNWRRVLFVSENTGFFEVHMDPRFSTSLYAVAHQRMRKGFTGVGGGDESAIYRSMDSGATWQKIMRGLPTENVGRIGLSVSPANPDVIYALVQAKEEGGVYRSSDRGASWTKQSGYNPSYPFYMQKIFADPSDENKIYSMDILIQVSIDAGKTFKPLGEKFKHVDNHALWIDPADTRHLVSGNDGGVYETWDMGQNWDFKSRIPIAEIYKVNTDNNLPFYNVYIGTQDNNSLGGPSRTINSSGITNADWVFTLGGDGFQTQADWKDANILYAQSQNGGLVRYDKKSGEGLFIQPVNPVDSGYRFDWDAPLLISAHDNKRLYFAANKLFRTNNQGNSWDVISHDLTRGVPQKMQKLMGRSWSIDELASKGSLANITTIAESPLDENMIYVGTGDGLIQFSNDGGRSWVKASAFPGVTEFTRIHKIIASRFSKMVAYAACQAFTYGDYKPCLLKTSDGGRTWTSLNANLPVKGNTYSIAEDHVKSDLLFAGTQFGLYFTVDGGKEWIKMNQGLPVNTVMDMDIQRRENDLVVSTFGRGVYILDDYSPLRQLSKENIQKPFLLFPVKDALMYVEANPFGFRGKGFMGAGFFTTPNPRLGAAFTYYCREEAKTLKQKRRDAEKEKQKKGEDIDFPAYDIIKKEVEEDTPYLLFTITDEQGNIVRKLKTEVKKGVNRLNWDMRYLPLTPLNAPPFDDSYAWNEPDRGYMVVPGTYKVGMQLSANGVFKELSAPLSFNCRPLNNSSLPAPERSVLDDFNKKVAEITRAITGADEFRAEMTKKIPYFKQAAQEIPSVPVATIERITALQRKLEEVNIKINGDGLRARYEGAAAPSLKGRIDNIVGSLWSTSSAPTETFKASYKVAADAFGNILDTLKGIADDIRHLEALLENYKAPFTPGRLPEWKKN